MIRRIILPERVLGRSGTMYTFLGAAKGPITLRTWSTSSLLRPSSLSRSYLNSLQEGTKSSAKKSEDDNTSKWDGDTRFGSNDSMKGLASQVISCSNCGSLSHAGVQDERRFDFRRRQA